MTLFPFFANIEGARVLIAGGGRHALEKIRKLKPYGPKLSVISEKFLPEIEADQELCLIRRGFSEEDLLKTPVFVIAAEENTEENHRIASLCRERKIPVNTVDDKEYCDFIFPALIARGNLSVGICTNGASPAAGVLLKKQIASQIPEHIEEILDFLQEKRPEVTRAIPDKKQRFRFFHQLSEICMQKDRPLTEREFTRLLSTGSLWEEN